MRQVKAVRPQYGYISAVMAQPLPSSNPSAQPRPPVSGLSPAAFLTRLIAGVVLLNLFIFTMVGLSIQHSHHQYQERAEITTRNLTQTLESEIASAIKTEDLALLAVIDEYQRQASTGTVDAEALNAYTERVRSRLPEIDALRITDATGMLIYGEDVTPGAQISLADRPHFVRLRDDPNAGLVISKPQVSRVNQKWVIVLARRIDQPDGSFGGMVFAAITLEHLSQTFSTLNVGAHGVVVLRDQELGVIARYPELQGVVGSTVMAREFKEMITAQSAGTTLARSRLDQFERAYSYRKVGAYPFYIFVGLATEDYLSVWREKAIQQAALLALFALVTVSSAWLIYRIWKRQANLEQEKEKYWRFFQLSADLMCIADPFGCFTQVNPAFMRLTGYSETELISKPFLEFILPEDRQQTADEMKLQVSLRASLNFENRYVCKDGSVVFLSWTAYFDKSDGVTYATARDVTALKQAEVALQEARELIDEVQRLSKLGGWRYDCATRRVTWTDEVYRIHGVGKDYDPSNLESDIRFYSHEDTQTIQGAFKKAVDDGEPYDLELRLNRQNGERIWVRTTGIARMNQGKVASVTGYIIDITEHKQAELALLKSKQMYDNLVAKITVGIYILRSTPEGTFTLDYVSPRMAEIVNINVKKLLTDAQALFQNIHPDDLDGFVKLNQDGIQLRRPFDWTGRFQIEGSIKWLHVESSPEAQENGDVLWHGLITDISATRRMQEEVRQLAFYDPLTKLPNRRLLNDRLSQSISASKRSGFYSAVIFLDLDNFKPLNDAHGHAAGDLLLIEVARRLKYCVREIDTVARVGGDEFVVLLSALNADRVDSTAQARIVAEKIRIALSEPYLLTISHHERRDVIVEHRCSASVGVVVYINHEGSHDDILHWADSAMYQAKEAGRNSIRFYDLKA